MKKGVIKAVICSVVAAFLFSVYAYADGDVTKQAAEYITKSASVLYPGTTGGEWAVIGLVRSDSAVPEGYFDRYMNNLSTHLKSCDGKLSERKYTEYSRVSLALAALGKNPADFSGYDVLSPLAEYEKVVYQGVNGAVWALVALDCGITEAGEEYDDVRKQYVDYILKSQLPDGGWSITGLEPSEADMTAMAVLALNKYTASEDVKKSADKGLSCLSGLQKDDGGFENAGTPNSESSAQAAVAISALGINDRDERFVKNGKSVYDNIISYKRADGGFAHLKDGDSSLMATEQCLYAIEAIERCREKAVPLFDMSDINAEEETAEAVSNGVINVPVKLDKTAVFTDIDGHVYRDMIKALTDRGIINGMTDTTFAPDEKLTRAQYSVIIVKALGLDGAGDNTFSDVPDGIWCAPYVNTAADYGIISGVGEGEFCPDNTITREAALAVAARTARLCGMNVEINDAFARDVLSVYDDYKKVSAWAVGDVAFCCYMKIYSNGGMEFKPQEEITRAEAAYIIYNVLERAELLDE